MSGLNANPVVYDAAAESTQHCRIDMPLSDPAFNEEEEDEIDAEEVFDILRHINDPEHPLSLEQLKVMQLGNIKVDNKHSRIQVNFTPTIPHCSMATLIGLCVRVKLIRSLPRRFKVDISITPGTHASEVAVNKQLNDKERVAAALENNNLLDVLNKCIANTDPKPAEDLIGATFAR